MKVNIWNEQTLTYWIKRDGEEWNYVIKPMYVVKRMPLHVFLFRRFFPSLNKKVVEAYFYKEDMHESIRIPADGNFYLNGINLHAKE